MKNLPCGQDGCDDQDHGLVLYLRTVVVILKRELRTAQRWPDMLGLIGPDQAPDAKEIPPTLTTGGGPPGGGGERT